MVVHREPGPVASDDEEGGATDHFWSRYDNARPTGVEGLLADLAGQKSLVNRGGSTL
jgi:hypothetical protein